MWYIKNTKKANFHRINKGKNRRINEENKFKLTRKKIMKMELVKINSGLDRISFMHPVEFCYLFAILYICSVVLYLQINFIPVTVLPHLAGVFYSEIQILTRIPK